jgi:hypothetical protein
VCIYIYIYTYIYVEEKPCTVHSVVSIGARLGAERSVVKIPAEARCGYLLHNVKTVSGAHPAFYSMYTGVQPSRGEADNTTLSNVEIENEWSCASTVPTCHHGPYRDNILDFIQCHGIV